MPFCTYREEGVTHSEKGLDTATIEVKTKDGRVLKQEVPLPKGHPRNQLTLDEFKDRFRRAASFALRESRIEQAIDKIINLENVKDISEVADVLHN